MRTLLLALATAVVAQGAPPLLDETFSAPTLPAKMSRVVFLVGDSGDVKFSHLAP